MTVIGHIKPYQIPEYVKTILKIKEDTLLFNIPLSFCKENKINPENLKFDIIKDSKNKIWLAQRQSEPTEIENHTPLKMEASNIGK